MAVFFGIAYFVRWISKAPEGHFVLIILRGIIHYVPWYISQLLLFMWSSKVYDGGNSLHMHCHKYQLHKAI